MNCYVKIYNCVCLVYIQYIYTLCKYCKEAIQSVLGIVEIERHHGHGLGHTCVENISMYIYIKMKEMLKQRKSQSPLIL